MRAARVLGVTWLMGCLLPHAIHAQTTQPTRVELDGFGLAFDIPTGWKRVPELRYSQLARLAQIKDNTVVGLIEIEALQAHGKSIGELALQLTSKRGAQPLGERKVKDLTTIEMKLPPAAGMNASGVTCFAMHKQFVMIQVSGADDAAVLEAMRAVTPTVAISDAQPTDLDLHPRALSIPIFDSKVRLSLPESFRPAKDEPAGAQTFFAVRNWASGRDEASVELQLIANPNHANLKQIMDATAPGIATKLGLREPIHFVKVGENPEVYLSSSFPVDTSGMQRLVFVTLDESRFASMVFGSNAADPAARQRYMTMVENVCKRLRVSEK